MMDKLYYDCNKRGFRFFKDDNIKDFNFSKPLIKITKDMGIEMLPAEQLSLKYIQMYIIKVTFANINWVANDVKEGWQVK